MSMPSDLAATSPLLLQLSNPPGVHITKQADPDPIPDPGPLAPAGTPCSHLSLPKVQASRPAVFPYSSPRLQEQPPTSYFFPF